MNAISVTELCQHLSQYLTRAQTEEVVVALDTGELVRLSGMTPEDLADEAIEGDERFHQLIAERRTSYQRTGGVPFAVVQQTLVNELISDLDQSDPHVREEAARHLIALGEPALRPLIDHYLRRKGSG